MPQNKRESLIYTFIMCFMMVFLDEHIQRIITYGSGHQWNPSKPDG